MKRKTVIAVSAVSTFAAFGLMAASTASATVAAPPGTPSGNLTVYMPKTQTICIGLLNPDGTQHPLLCLNLPNF